jgi:hypothetical protein
MEIRRYVIVFCALAAAGGAAACSGGSSMNGTGGATGSGSGGRSGTGGGAGGGGGGAATCPGAVITPTVDCPTLEVMPPTGTFPNGAACGEDGNATAEACSYDGYEEFTVWGEDGLGDPITSRVCVVRFDVKRVGNAPAGCAKCAWTQTVEYSNPRVMVDTSGACANSSFGLSTDKIARLNGCRVAVGFEPNCLDHDGACRWKYYVSMGMWAYASGVTYCTAAAAAGGNCSPANGLRYNPKTACTYR